MTREQESSPFGHIHKGIDTLAKPSSSIQTTAIGWIYDPINVTEQVTKKAALAQEMLESLSVIKENEKDAFAIELSIATAYGDLVALDFVIHKLRLALSVKGKGHNDILKIVGGSTPKISVPTTMSKVRRVLTGRGGKVEEAETTDGYEIAGRDGEG